jgi:hypothetical protein
MFFRWRRLDKPTLQLVWPLYGQTSALISIGSCCGVVSWLAWMNRSTGSVRGRALTADDSLGQAAALFADASIWWCVFKIAYAVEFYCVTFIQLFVISRMADFADASLLSVSRKRFAIAFIFANFAACLCGNIVSSVYSAQSAQSWSEASAHFDAKNVDAFRDSNQRAFELRQDALEAASVQYFCEVIVLLAIIATFVFVAVVCARRVRTLLSNTTEGQHVLIAALTKKLNSKIVGTTVFIFATLLLRSTYSTMYAIANQLQDQNKPCSAPLTPLKFCNTACYNVYTQAQVWLDRTPEFQTAAVLLSSPLALVVARWGMIPNLPDRRVPRGIEGL